MFISGGTADQLFPRDMTIGYRTIFWRKIRAGIRSMIAVQFLTDRRDQQ
jgi:hypothetical protein